MKPISESRELGVNPVVDMSPEAIDHRLRDLSQIFKLGMTLREARIIGKVADLAGNADLKFPTERSPPKVGPG